MIQLAVGNTHLTSASGVVAQRNVDPLDVGPRLELEVSAERHPVDGEAIAGLGRREPQPSLAVNGAAALVDDPGVGVREVVVVTVAGYDCAAFIACVIRKGVDVVEDVG